MTRGRRAASAFRRTVVLLAVAAAAFAQNSAVAPIDISLDPASTQIHWTLNTTLHNVHGTFRLKSGAFRIDPATGEASGQIVIDATSGESGDSSRDNRMHSVILESPKFPTITFRPTHVAGKVDLAAAGPVTVAGFLNLHGLDHPIEITVNLHPQARAVALSSHFTVPFVAWGLKDPSVAFLRTDKEVTLDVDAVAAPVTSRSSLH